MDDISINNFDGYTLVVTSHERWWAAASVAECEETLDDYGYQGLCDYIDPLKDSRVSDAALAAARDYFRMDEDQDVSAGWY